MLPRHINQTFISMDSTGIGSESESSWAWAHSRPILSTAKKDSSLESSPSLDSDVTALVLDIANH